MKPLLKASILLSLVLPWVLVAATFLPEAGWAGDYPLWLVQVQAFLACWWIPIALFGSRELWDMRPEVSAKEVREWVELRKTWPTPRFWVGAVLYFGLLAWAATRIHLWPGVGWPTAIWVTWSAAFFGVLKFRYVANTGIATMHEALLLRWARQGGDESVYWVSARHRLSDES